MPLDYNPATTVTVAGSVSITGTPTVDTELPAAAALADATANPTVPAVAADNLLFNGTTWDRMRGDIANGLDVDVTRVGGTVTASVTGTVTVVQSLDTIMLGGVAYTVKSAQISVTASGDTTVIALVAAKKIRVLKALLGPDAAVNIAWKSGGGSTLISAMGFARGVGSPIDAIPGYLCETVAGEALVMNLSGAVNVRGTLVYIEV